MSREWCGAGHASHEKKGVKKKQEGQGFKSYHDNTKIICRAKPVESGKPSGKRPYVSASSLYGGG